MHDAAERPLGIFISYGHPEDDICRRIKRWLERRGHRVWLDKDKIGSGDDWRYEIERGIKASQVMIFCLSEHSTRADSVCLDELGIALDLIGGNICPVLLEPEERVDIPAPLSRLQWVDMRDWRQRLNSPDFEPWFDARMRELIRGIESPESMRFAGEIEKLKRRLTVNSGTARQRSLLSDRNYVGREWLASDVRAWLDDPEGAPLCVLYGDPGVGKSTFAAHFAHYNPAVAASLFLSHDQVNDRVVCADIMTCAYLLACRIADFRQKLLEALDALEGQDLSQYGASKLFDMLIAEPASKTIDGNQKTLCIVIDGLDQCSAAKRNALAKALSDNCEHSLPRWLRILATSRDAAEIRAPLAGAFQLTLRGEESRNRADLRAYFERMLGDSFGSDPAWPAALDALTARSGGIFLYAQRMVDALRSEGAGAGIRDAARSMRLPRMLSADFYRWFSKSFPDVEEYRDRYRLPLGMILAATMPLSSKIPDLPEPLPRDELMRVMNRRSAESDAWDEMDRDDFLNRIQGLYRVDRSDFDQETVRIDSPDLREWLNPKSQDCAHVYAVNLKAAFSRMADAFYEYFTAEQENSLTCFYELEPAWNARTEDMLEYLDSSPAPAMDFLSPAPFDAKLEDPEPRLAFDGDVKDPRCEAKDFLPEFFPIEAIEREEDFTPYEALHLIPFLKLTTKNRGRLDEVMSSPYLLDKILNLGERCVRRGKLERAVSCYEKALEIAENVDGAEGDSKRRQSPNLLGILCAKLAEAEWKLGRLDAAGRHCNRAILARRQACAKPLPPECRCALGGLYRLAADIWLARNDPDRALKWYEKSRALLSTLEGAPEVRRELSATLDALLRLPNLRPEARRRYLADQSELKRQV